MYPILFQFQLGGQWLVVPAYGTAMTLSLLTIALGGWAMAMRRRLPCWPAFACSAAVTLAFPIGSRILYWAMNPELRRIEPDLLLRAQFSGFYIIGGLALAVAVAAVFCRFLHLDFWRMADTFAPAMGIGGAILRVGCFLNGCCFGRPTTLPWGVAFPVGSPAHLDQASERLDLLFATPLPVHPTQIYEMAASLAAAGIALAVIRRRLPDGVAALAASLWFILFRWLNSFFRVCNTAQSWPASITTLLYVSVVVLCLALLVWRLRRTADASGLEGMSMVPCSR